MKLVSIVVPVFNEEDNIQHFYESVCENMAPLPYDFELVFVDDGSKDRSREILRSLEQKDKRVQSIFLARNSGHQLALTCGLVHSEMIDDVNIRISEVCVPQPIRNARMNDWTISFMCDDLKEKEEFMNCLTLQAVDDLVVPHHHQG